MAASISEGQSTDIRNSRSSHKEKKSTPDTSSAPAPESETQYTDVEKSAEEAKPKPPARESPNGGLAAWLVVLGAWCTSFCSFGWLNSIGVFQEYYQNVLLSQYSPSTISWIPSLQIFFMMGMGPVIGVIYDHYGPRWLLLGGTFLHVFGVMMASLGKEYYQILLAQGVCSAIGVSAIFQPAFTSVQGWFSKRHGAAFGVLFTGSSAGGIVFPIMVSHLIREVSFGWAMRVSAFLMLFLLVIANLTVRPFDRPCPDQHRVSATQLRKPFTELNFLLVTGAAFWFSYGFFVPINYLPAQAFEAGVDPELVQYLLPILNAASLFGRLSAGVASDKFGPYNVFVAVSYLSGIWILGLWLPEDSSAGAIVAFAVLFGFSSAAYVSLLAQLVMAISPMNLADIGFRIGVVLFVTAVGGLTTNPVNGAILRGGGGWTGLKVFSGVFCIAGTTLVLIVRIRRAGWRLFVKV
ncbi:hypothetical protein PV08_01211 [Exophiala spinifera]|uniref:Major facilitator superfamily (MFS) profile domain-containing protein n=1 Tax=Exophiala spinifera TaxID=91928 RepID=A0A0D2BQ59_9EURO|nr:uncharacterized protein PV08_01211 [Exophiala spinifera]KIW20635.1 hypothetical protein PV08_01211 [Exophiala spinifera]